MCLAIVTKVSLIWVTLLKLRVFLLDYCRTRQRFDGTMAAQALEMNRILSSAAERI
jgi:hypothetical protein